MWWWKGGLSGARGEGVGGGRAGNHLHLSVVTWSWHTLRSSLIYCQSQHTSLSFHCSSLSIKLSNPTTELSLCLWKRHSNVYIGLKQKRTLQVKLHRAIKYNMQSKHLHVQCTRNYWTFDLFNHIIWHHIQKRFPYIWRSWPRIFKDTPNLPP